MTHGLLYRFRLWLMWRIAPIEKRTVSETLPDLIENDYPEEYDTAGELGYLLGIESKSYFDAENNE